VARAIDPHRGEPDGQIDVGCGKYFSKYLYLELFSIQTPVTMIRLRSISVTGTHLLSLAFLMGQGWGYTMIRTDTGNWIIGVIKG
jgi:hypothetical protein